MASLYAEMPRRQPQKLQSLLQTFSTTDIYVLRLLPVHLVQTIKQMLVSLWAQQNK